MSEDERKGYEDIIHLQETIINQLIESLQHFVDCDGLPCVALINEAAGIRAEMLRKKDDVLL